MIELKQVIPAASCTEHGTVCIRKGTPRQAGEAEAARLVDSGQCEPANDAASKALDKWRKDHPEQASQPAPRSATKRQPPKATDPDADALT